jgi:hypothetical protein
MNLISTINHNIKIGNNLYCILRNDHVSYYPERYIRILSIQHISGYLGLLCANIARAKENLTVQIGFRHKVSIYYTDGPNTSSGKVLQDGATQSTGTNYQNLGFSKFLLAAFANFV